MNIFTLTIALSVITFIAIGGWMGKKVKNVDDYFVAGRNAPTLLIVGTLVASVFSTSIFLGEAGFTYDGQLGPYLLLPGIAVTGYVYGALFFGTFLRRSNAPTVAAYFGERFDSRRVQQLAGLTIVLGLGGYLLVVTQGAALLLADLTGVSYPIAVVLAWLSYSSFTLYAGSKGVIVSDTLMFLFFSATTIVFVAYLVNSFGGFQFTIEELTRQDIKPDLTAWHGTIGPDTPWPTAVDFLIWLVIIDIAWSIVYAVSPWQSSRHLMAKNEHVVIRASIYACFAVIFLQILIYGAGGFINLAKYDIDPSETVMLWAAQNVVPELLGALLLAGIFAAALSSASTFLSLVGFSLSNDLRSDKTTTGLSLTRVLTGIISLAVLALSIALPPNVFWIMLFIGTVFASSWGPVALMSVWSKRITANAAFWGMGTGLLGNIIPASLDYAGLISLPSYLEPALLGVCTGLLVIFVISRKGNPSQKEMTYLSKLHHVPEEDCDPGQTRHTLIAARLLIVYGITMPFITLLMYVKPYQRGTSTIRPDDTINWTLIEPWIAFGPAILFIPLGTVAFITIKRRYQRAFNEDSD